MDIWLNIALNIRLMLKTMLLKLQLFFGCNFFICALKIITKTSKWRDSHCYFFGNNYKQIFKLHLENFLTNYYTTGITFILCFSLTEKIPNVRKLT